ncbi:MAG: transglycosylase SLT domain-containing protein [Paludibacteraceae bacterium]|nr:transglycosylase SLT domain-containing protein [Paludibacteraceae bacterium]
MKAKGQLIVVAILLGILALGVFQGVKRSKLSEPMNEGPVPYYAVFERLAPTIGWEWSMLAAVAWNESHFNPQAKSHVGARGIMQLMPKTARRFGLNDSTMLIPEDNIRAGVEYIRYLQDKWSFISNMEEQTKFVLASYNAGPGFIFEARREAKAHGGNPYVWHDVEPYVKQEVTRKYVHNVLRTKSKYDALIDTNNQQ